jgi:lipopolysaccharide/colanic/teichoic acid biosynthesis glycosyltransferase
MLLLKPGITGPASLKYRDEEELLAEQENPQKYNDEVLFPDKVRINIEYLDNWSFWNASKSLFTQYLVKIYKLLSFLFIPHYVRKSHNCKQSKIGY